MTVITPMIGRIINSKEGTKRIINLKKCFISIPLSIKCTILKVCVIHTKLVSNIVNIARVGIMLLVMYFLYVNMSI